MASVFILHGLRYSSALSKEDWTSLFLFGHWDCSDLKFEASNQDLIQDVHVVMRTDDEEGVLKLETRPPPRIDPVSTLLGGLWSLAGRIQVQLLDPTQSMPCNLLVWFHAA